MLVEVINKYHRRHHFLEILTEVTRLVVKRGNSVQVPAPMDTLTKFLYLWEGTEPSNLLLTARTDTLTKFLYLWERSEPSDLFLTMASFILLLC